MLDEKQSLFLILMMELQCFCKTDTELQQKSCCSCSSSVCLFHTFDTKSAKLSFPTRICSNKAHVRTDGISAGLNLQSEKKLK